ncbi:MAG: mechanosensitive ion channel family protein [Bacteriovoracaceae bacterium]
MFVKWIPVEKIQPILSFEAFAITCSLVLIAYLFYYFFLKRLSAKRHGQLRHRFIMTSIFIGLCAVLAGIHWGLYFQHVSDPALIKFSSYLSLIALFMGAIAIIKVAQIYIYLYLFFSNMETGVPRLISNLFSFVFSLFIFSILASSVFDFNIAAIATTSAVFSLVLGLALQDTLGNFFSGLALQIDSPFNINDWVEIQSGDQKCVGQVQEINWRATSLLTFADELVVYPNKTMAQSQITILTHPLRSIRLNQAFRFTYDTPLEQAKLALLESVGTLKEVVKDPGPTTLIMESTDSWVTIKLFYSLNDYGARYRVGDIIIANVFKNLKKYNITLAHQTFTIEQ